VKWAFALILVMASGLAYADSQMPKAQYADVQLRNPAQEQQAKALMETIRCLVCQGQSIADSDAEMAADMRSLIRKRIAAGEKPDAIRGWLIERYGNYVSYEPPFTLLGAPLWLLPLLLLVGGAWFARRRFKRKAT
jgi:cytochrome c-type biogenesis protein CcmH